MVDGGLIDHQSICAMTIIWIERVDSSYSREMMKAIVGKSREKTEYLYLQI